MRRLIKVTKKHIKNGIPCVDDACPVALAIMEADKALAIEPLVGPEIIWICRKSVMTPQSVYRFVTRFDNGKKVQPFNFYLDY